MPLLMEHSLHSYAGDLSLHCRKFPYPDRPWPPTFCLHEFQLNAGGIGFRWVSAPGQELIFPPGQALVVDTTTNALKLSREPRGEVTNGLIRRVGDVLIVTVSEPVNVTVYTKTDHFKSLLILMVDDETSHKYDLSIPSKPGPSIWQRVLRARDEGFDFLESEPEEKSS